MGPVGPLEFWVQPFARWTAQGISLSDNRVYEASLLHFAFHKCDHLDRIYDTTELFGTFSRTHITLP